MESRPYIAHTRQSDKEQQTLETHLSEASDLCKDMAAKIGMPEAGELIGLLHFSAVFGWLDILDAVKIVRTYQ